jgi:tetratricopeptide (TPR) repeat protein
LRALAWPRPEGDTSSYPWVTFTEGHDLFTPQQLFGEVESSADVLSHAPFLERARDEHVRERELAARLALGAYLVSRLVDRLLAEDESAAAQEAMLWQLDAVRRHLRELPPDSPESAHLHGITDAIPTGSQSLASLRLSLMAYAYFLEHEGRLEEALEVLALAVRTHGGHVPAGDFAASGLFAGRLNRLLARWPAATACYTAAESAAETAGDAVLVLRARLGRGAVLRGQGNLPLARQVAEDVAAAAHRTGLREVEAMAYADLGSALSNEGRRIEAIQAIYQSFLLSDDLLQRTRVLGDLGTALVEIGAADAARTAFEIVLRSKTSFIVRMNAVLELMDMESAAGNRMAFERRRGEAEAARLRMPPSMLADYQYKAGIGLARFGQITRGRDFLMAGLQHSENSRLNAWYFRFERALKNLAGCESREPDLVPLVTGETPPAIQEVAIGLRDFALQST